MKKFIFISFIFTILLMVGMQVQAQETTSTTLSPGQTLFESDSPLLDSDSLHTAGDSVYYWTIKLNKPVEVLYDVQVELDSLSGTPDYDVDLKGKVFDNDSWTDLETDVTWDGTSSDTTILFQEHSTAVFVTQLQLQVNGQAGTGGAAIGKISVKVWE